MWRRHSPWLNITVLCSGEDDEDMLVDTGTYGEVGSRMGERGFFSNVTTVLPLPGLVRGHTGAFWTSKQPSLTPHWHKDARNGKSAA